MRKLTWAQKRCKLSDSVARFSYFFPNIHLVKNLVTFKWCLVSALFSKKLRGAALSVKIYNLLLPTWVIILHNHSTAIFFILSAFDFVRRRLDYKTVSRNGRISATISLSSCCDQQKKKFYCEFSCIKAWYAMWAHRFRERQTNVKGNRTHDVINMLIILGLHPKTEKCCLRSIPR